LCDIKASRVRLVRFNRRTAASRQKALGAARLTRKPDLAALARKAWRKMSQGLIENRPIRLRPVA
jgi:hypothetical protein